MQLAVAGEFTDGVVRDGTTYEGTSYVSSDTNIATVDANGLVTTVGQGTVTITVSTTVNGVTKTDTATIEAVQAKLTGVQVTPAHTDLPNGMSQQLIATAIFDNGQSKELKPGYPGLSWSTTGTVVVDQNGVVTATTASNATSIVTATVTINGETASGTATVKQVDAQLTSIAIDPSSAKIAKNGKIQIDAVATLSDGSTRVVTEDADWHSSDTNVATVVTDSRRNNGKVTAIGDVGDSATITASYEGFEATCTVTIEAIPEGYIYLENIRFENSLTTVNDTSVEGTLKDGHYVIYGLQDTQGYAADQNISELSFDFNATWVGGSKDGTNDGIFVSVYLNNTDGSSIPGNCKTVSNGEITRCSIYTPQDWTDLKNAHPYWTVSDQWYEWSETYLRQMNFVLRFGSNQPAPPADATGFKIDKFIVK